MKIEVLIQGEPDIKPFTKVFHHEKDDKVIFFEYLELIKKRLLGNMRLNINEVLGLFVGYIITSLEENKTNNEIQENLPKLLAPNQVMIGVPESLRQLTFTITTEDNKNKKVAVTTPIHINQSFLYEQGQSA